MLEEQLRNMLGGLGGGSRRRRLRVKEAMLVLEESIKMSAICMSVSVGLLDTHPLQL